MRVLRNIGLVLVLVSCFGATAQAAGDPRGSDTPKGQKFSVLVRAENSLVHVDAICGKKYKRIPRQPMVFTTMNTVKIDFFGSYVRHGCMVIIITQHTADDGESASEVVYGTHPL
jgi:hypothetical protein